MARRTLSINRAPVQTLWAAVHTKDGLRALAKEKPVDPKSVERYLESKFGDGLEDARNAMRQLAKSRPPAKLAGEAYHLYEKFRPSVPAGTPDLARIRKLAG